MNDSKNRLYFRQLLSGRDFAQNNQIAQQMINFVYFIGDRETGEAVIVDPAYDIQGLLKILESDGMKCTGVLATHYHPDHVGGSMMGYNIDGVKELLEHTSVPIHAQQNEAQFIQKVTGIGQNEIIAHEGSETISVGKIDIELIHTPGHTPGSQCFLVDNCLVAGDTLFLEGCGRTDLPGGDPAALYESLTHRLGRVPDDAILFPGHQYSHAPSASMGETRRENYVFMPKSEEQWLAMFGH
ncbi:MAG TPA: MBL fold metallo-hydrolase [Acidimicrobiales bacterium]|jgi:glyoxylase-like metal-dependent hydrolase (beta-lactamase superfamily II)|nr:MBL fold metallo-hydrolase [Acidimicrobiales bacterium]|tara:strand:- start:1071 stop:1793 length:723 start_codon:yes stop_codon:yes gene_type:complete